MRVREVTFGAVLLVVLAAPVLSQTSDAGLRRALDYSQTQTGTQGNGIGDKPEIDPAQAIMHVQRKLKEQGYFTGSINGNWGPSSVAALQLYQRDHGLEPTGDMDQDTAGALGLSLGEFAAFVAGVEQPDDEGPPQTPDTPQAPDQDPDENSDQPPEVI